MMKKIQNRLGYIFIIALLWGSIGVANGAPLAQKEEPPVKEQINHDLTQFDGDLTISENTVVNGSVAVFSGNAFVAGEVNGDVAVLSGNINVSGIVRGDVAVLSGNIDLSGAEIDGDVVIFSGNITFDQDSKITGDCVVLSGNRFGEVSEGQAPCTSTNIPLQQIFTPPAKEVDGSHEMPPIATERVEDPLSWGDVFSRTIILSLLAFVIGSIFPNHLVQVSDALKQKPLISGVVGVLTIPAGFSLMIILMILATILIVTIVLSCIGILGFPLMFALMLLGTGAGLLGWSAVGTVIGGRLAQNFNWKSISLPSTAALGTAVLTLSLGATSLLIWGFGSWLLTTLFFITGLGATMLTKLGRASYPPTAVFNQDKVQTVLDTMA